MRAGAMQGPRERVGGAKRIGRVFLATMVSERGQFDCLTRRLQWVVECFVASVP
jgi:hypothetical protein